MSKSTIFTAFLAGLMMVIMAEFLVARFGNSEHLKADVLDNEGKIQMSEVKSEGQNSKAEGIASQSSVNGSGNGNFLLAVSPNAHAYASADTGTQQTFSMSLLGPVEKQTSPSEKVEAPKTLESSKITFPILQQAGFEESVFQRIPFDGWLFGKLDLKTDLTLPVTVQNLLKNNVAKVATFYEFETKSKTLADRTYDLLKTKFSHLKGAGVNPTDEFLEHSFYVNFSQEPKRAFLVVKKGENVYALTYGKESHPFITMLLPLLP